MPVCAPRERTGEAGRLGTLRRISEDEPGLSAPDAAAGRLG
jgi:hypothetical protein